MGFQFNRIQKYGVNKMVTVGFGSQVPLIDGRCTAEEWGKSVLFTGFIDNFSRMYAYPQTRVTLQFDNNKLYVAFISPVGSSGDWFVLAL